MARTTQTPPAPSTTMSESDLWASVCSLTRAAMSSVGWRCWRYASASFCATVLGPDVPAPMETRRSSLPAIPRSRATLLRAGVRSS